MPQTPPRVAFPTRRWWIEAALGFVLYLLAGRFVIALLLGKGTSIWYPPLVVGTVMFLRLGTRALPIVLLADVLVCMAQFGRQPVFIAALSGPTVLEAWISSALIGPLLHVRTWRWPPSFAVRVGLASVLGPTVGAALGSGLLMLLRHPGRIEVRNEWISWWLSDLATQLTLLPLALAWVIAPPSGPRPRRESAGPVEAIAVVVAGVVLADVLLGSATQPLGSNIGGLEMLVLLPASWAAMRFRPRFAFGLVALMALAAVTGLYVWPSLSRRFATGLDPIVVSTQVSMIVLAVTVLVMVTLREGHRGAMARVQESEADLRHAQRTARMGTVRIDHRSGEQQWSEEMWRMLGLEPNAHVVGWDAWCSVLHPDDLEASRRAMESLPDAYPEGPTRRRVRLPNGSERILEVRIERMPERDDHVRSLVTMLDVTDLVALERQFQHAQRLESVGRLAGGVAHDFNNLLTVIRGFVDLSRLESDVSPRVRSNLDEVDRAAGRATELTRQLLAFGRRTPRDVRVLDLGRLVLDFELTIRRLVGEGVHVAVNARPGETFVAGDASQIEQVLMNLVVNAGDAMPGGGRLEVRVWPPRREPAREPAGSYPGPERCAVLDVRDSGVGMDEATRERIFEPFFTTKEPGKGTGLGLSTVFGIVEQHSGRIEVDTQPDRGSRFRVLLPACAPRAEGPPAPPRREVPAAERASLLVVEDDAAVRRFLREALERQGWQVHTAADALEARACMERDAAHMDAIITDVLLPGVDGLTLAREFRRVRPGLPLLFVTGYAGESRDFGELLRIGPVLAKPVRAEELVASVAALLRDRRDVARGAVTDG